MEGGLARFLAFETDPLIRKVPLRSQHCRHHRHTARGADRRSVVIHRRSMQVQMSAEAVVVDGVGSREDDRLDLPVPGRHDEGVMSVQRR